MLVAAFILERLIFVLWLDKKGIKIKYANCGNSKAFYGECFQTLDI